MVAICDELESNNKAVIDSDYAKTADVNEVLSG